MNFNDNEKQEVSDKAELFLAAVVKCFILLPSLILGFLCCFMRKCIPSYDNSLVVDKKGSSQLCFGLSVFY